MNFKQKIIIENERDERIYDWLLKTVNEEEINNAISSIQGNQKPYLTNILKKLGLKAPNSITQTPKEIARQNLNRILKYIDEKKTQNHKST